MGEQQLEQVTSDELVYVPVAEFRRLLDARLPRPAAAEAFAALARINTLYMIARAWSGHIGTSFSSLEIMSWLFLHEIRDLDQGPSACDIFFSSKGHDAPALYSVLIGTGALPFDALHGLRHRPEHQPAGFHLQLQRNRPVFLVLLEQFKADRHVRRVVVAVDQHQATHRFGC